MTSRAVTRIAFGVVIFFVLTQVVWWIVFQRGYINSVTETTLAQWQRDADAATLLRAEGVAEDELLTLFPRLALNSSGNGFIIDPQVRQAFIGEQNGFTRMFAFEGPFFVLVVLAGLYVIARSLQTERELKRRQQNFLSAVTHEFKTPISTLRLLIETALMRTLPPEKQREYLTKMAGELSRLEQTSEQVLASARLEQSHEAPVLEPLELNSVVQGIVGRARAGLEARGATLKVTYNPDPLPVSLDISAFSVVLNNLLDNAVKYSNGANQPVTVRLQSQGDLVLMQVTDEGIGIADKDKAHVFERFYRVGSEMTRQSKGVGLGLYLVKSITEAMNGWVKVEPNVPKGTRFTVVLPKRVALGSEQEVRNVGSSLESSL